MNMDGVREKVAGPLDAAGFRGHITIEEAPSGAMKISAEAASGERFGVSIHPASPLRNAPSFPDSMALRMVDTYRYVMGGRLPVKRAAHG